MVKYLKRLQRKEQISLETGSKRYFDGKVIFQKGTEENMNNQYYFKTRDGELLPITHYGRNKVRMIEGRLIQLTLD